MARNLAPNVVSLFVLAALSLLVNAELFYYDSAGEDVTPNHVILAGPGAAQSMSFVYRGAKPENFKITNLKGDPLFLFEVSEPTISEGVKGSYNISATATAKNNVGVQPFLATVTDVNGKTFSKEGKLVLAGFVLTDDAGVVVSGDDGAGVTVGASGATKYAVKAIGTNGAKFDPSGTTMTFAEKSGTYMEEVDKSKTVFTAEEFTLALNLGRYGTGEFIITMMNDGITVDGEAFETVLIVKQTIPSSIKCYAKGGVYEINAAGQVRIPMYNLEKPPQRSAVKEITLSLGGKPYEYLSSASSRKIPTQEIVFRPEAKGVATIVCDGVEAVVNGNKGVVEITGNVPEQPGAKELLAKHFTKVMDVKAGFAIVSLTLTDFTSSPDMMLKSTMDSMLGEIKSIAKGTEVLLEKVTEGSFVGQCAVRVPEGQEETAVNSLEAACNSPSCPIAKAGGKNCEDIKCTNFKFQRNDAKSGVGGTAFTVTPGLATWTIVLIAVVGAFAIILLIMLALWAVYRRNAEVSESDYSSSGPLGVPDPSDLLYEQSIVRDIYGRGDFPEGGPTPAAAAERAREADLREEFPRPPSSSGVSRAAQTDDASSTYSV